MSTQQPQYDSFIQSGLSIVDKCLPDSADAADINHQLEEVNRGWDRLQQKLDDRSGSVRHMQELSEQFYKDLQELGEWIGNISDELDGLAPVGVQPEVIAEQKLQVEVRKISGLGIEILNSEHALESFHRCSY